ncbi:hypothetical protein EV2_038231 [Malus domestica]
MVLKEVYSPKIPHFNLSGGDGKPEAAQKGYFSRKSPNPINCDSALALSPFVLIQLRRTTAHDCHMIRRWSAEDDALQPQP